VAKDRADGNENKTSGTTSGTGSPAMQRKNKAPVLEALGTVRNSRLPLRRLGTEASRGCRACRSDARSVCATHDYKKMLEYSGERKAG
jgi:hypothetical protein